MEEMAPKELNAYISEFIITVRKKDNNENYLFEKYLFEPLLGKIQLAVA